MSEKSAESPSEQTQPDNANLSVSETAKMAGVTPQAVRIAHRKGRLRRDPRGPAAPPRFTLEEVQRWITVRESGLKDHALVASEETELAKAESVTALIEMSLRHTENKDALLVKAVTASMADARALLAAAQTENERLRGRIQALETREDEILVTLAALNQKKYDDAVADLNASERKTAFAAAMKAATPFVGAAIARVLGGEQAQQGAFMQLVESLTDEQRDEFMKAAGAILTQSQTGSLMLLFSQWQAKASKKEATGPGVRDGDTERPPPPSHEPKQAA